MRVVEHLRAIESVPRFLLLNIQTIISCARHGFREKVMTKFLIITGTRDSGKTTTAGMVYKKLLPCAKNVCLTDGDGKVLTIDDPLLEDGKPKDFVAYLEVNGKKVAIVSIGDYPDYLEKQIKIYLDKVDYFVCCLRTRDREGSTRRMLITNYSNYPKEEFRTVHSEDKSQMFSIKEEIVEKIVSVIMSNK